MSHYTTILAIYYSNLFMYDDDNDDGDVDSDNFGPTMHRLVKFQRYRANTRAIY